jgi:hypothetical protein
MEAVTFFSLGFSRTLPMANCDSYTYEKTKFMPSENYRLASRGDIVPLPVTQTVCKARLLSSVQKQETCRNSPINQTIKKTITSAKNCNRVEQSQWSVLSVLLEALKKTKKRSIQEG